MSTATLTSKGLASVEMAKVLPKASTTNSTNQYMEVFRHPLSFKGAFMIITGFQDSTTNESVSIVLCRSHISMAAPTVIPLYGSSARPSIYGILDGSTVKYCVQLPSAYMHVQTISLHPSGTALLNEVSDTTGWSKLV